MDNAQKQIVERWTNAESYSAGWRSRARALVKVTSSNHSSLSSSDVVDLGCGPNMFIREELRALGHSGRLTMVDLTSWNSSVISADLNFGIPKAACCEGGVYFLSGVLEYILDPLALLNGIGEYAETISFSYACLNFGKKYSEISESPSSLSSLVRGRIRSGWTSHLTSSDILAAPPKGFRFIDVIGHGDTMAIFVLKKAY